MIKNILMISLGMSVFCTQSFSAAPAAAAAGAKAPPAKVPAPTQPHMDGHNAGMRETAKVIAKYEKKVKVKKEKAKVKVKKARAFKKINPN